MDHSNTLRQSSTCKGCRPNLAPSRRMSILSRLRTTGHTLAGESRFNWRQDWATVTEEGGVWVESEFQVNVTEKLEHKFSRLLCCVCLFSCAYQSTTIQLSTTLGRTLGSR
jgi:hypothetical protein